MKTCKTCWSRRDFLFRSGGGVSGVALAYLLNNKNRVVSRQAIAKHIYGNRTDDMPSFDFVY